LNFISGNLWSVTIETNMSWPLGLVNYTVYANDTLGQEVNLSGDLTTVTGPNITSVYDTPDPNGFGLNVSINCSIADSDGVDTGLVGITPPGGSETNYTMSNNSDSYYYNYSAWTNGTYNYMIYANDTLGLWSNSSQGSFDLYINLTIQVRTLKDEYGEGEYVNLTDPPV
jgi:hypothetical protein